MIARRGLLLGGVGALAACATGGNALHAAPSLSEQLAPLARFVGSWRGEGAGEPGQSIVTRTYAPVLGGRFLQVRNTSLYAPQPANPNGESHEDVGYVSFDRARGRLVFRQFHIEGFVNTYVATTPDFDGDTLVMLSESIENIPAGFRARETYRFAGPDAFEEIFEIAEPGADFAVYSRSQLQRA